MKTLTSARLGIDGGLSRRIMWTSGLGILAILFFGLLRPAFAENEPGNDGYRVIRVLSAPPNLVSGEDVLVRIDLSREAGPTALHVELDGRNVTAMFQADARPNTFTGLVRGLRVGKNLLSVSNRGRHLERIAITDYPITGPITSGPHETPWICTTADFQIYSGILGLVIPDKTTFNPPTDANCSAPTKITYLYLPKGGTALQALPSTTTLPADVSTTTTIAGETVNFIVRFETSTIDRGIYQSAVLHDPTTEPEPTWNAPPKGWNKRLIAIEGAGCPGGWYMQGTNGGSLPFLPIIDASLLSTSRLGEGYALFGNTLQDPSMNCNSVLSMEAATMGKEHFIKSYGVPQLTVSIGCSGGSYGSSMLADARPGLYDGVMIACVFPDPLGIAFSGSDGHLLTHYYAVTNPSEFTAAQQVAISGYKGLQALYDAANQAGRTDPVPGRVDIPGYASAVWSPVVPVSLQYNPVTNPRGARPTVYDVAHNIYGVDPKNGFALRPFDNVGVQYGLKALNSGVITTSQFLDLNEKIGGYDDDFNYVPNRVEGNLEAIKRGQLGGLQEYGGGGLASIPVFDYTGIFNDDGGYHYQWFHFAMRERMIEANGNADNYVMWRGNPVPFDAAWSTFIEWVSNVATDTSHRSQREKAIHDKPGAAVDGCWSSPTQFIPEKLTFSSLPNSQCNTLFPSYAFPRYIAGGPLAANIMKCHLKPIQFSDYAVTFTPSEVARLHKIFPHGVCNWEERGVHQTGVVTWGSFGPSPDNLVYDITGTLQENYIEPKSDR